MLYANYVPKTQEYSSFGVKSTCVWAPVGRITRSSAYSVLPKQPSVVCIYIQSYSMWQNPSSIRCLVKTQEKYVAQVLKIYIQLQKNLLSFVSVDYNFVEKQYVPNTYIIQKLRWAINQKCRCKVSGLSIPVQFTCKVRI